MSAVNSRVTSWKHVVTQFDYFLAVGFRGKGRFLGGTVLGGLVEVQKCSWAKKKLFPIFNYKFFRFVQKYYKSSYCSIFLLAAHPSPEPTENLRNHGSMVHLLANPSRGRSARLANLTDGSFVSFSPQNNTQQLPLCRLSFAFVTTWWPRKGEANSSVQFSFISIFSSIIFIAI